MLPSTTGLQSFEPLQEIIIVVIITITTTVRFGSIRV